MCHGGFPSGLEATAGGGYSNFDLLIVYATRASASVSRSETDPKTVLVAKIKKQLRDRSAYRKTEKPKSLSHCTEVGEPALARALKFVQNSVVLDPELIDAYDLHYLFNHKLDQ